MARLLRLIPLIVLVVASCSKPEDPPPVKPPVTPPPNNYGDCTKILIDGYTEYLSYKGGDIAIAMLNFSSNESPCNLRIYDVNGSLAFSVASPTIKQAISTQDASTNGYGYLPTVQIPIPTNLKSGIYLIENSIPFIVKPSAPVDALVVYPSNTVNAYSRAGGHSMYDGASRVTTASFQRPFQVQWQSLICLQWLTTQREFNFGYICDSDLDDAASLPSFKIIIIPGHSEYWTRKARVNFDRYVDQGHHALILSGNTMWWQVRYSADKTKMICYKDAALDPEPDRSLATITWDMPSLNYYIIPSIGADFNHGGYGLLTDRGWDGYMIATPSSPLFEGLSLLKGDILHIPSGEYDGAPILQFDANGFPILDKSATGFKKLELIGFDKGARNNAETIGTFIVGQKNDQSGIIINAASYDWCSYRGMGGQDGDKIKRITYNAIKKLLRGERIFSQ
jgi:hypothetical protein